MTAIWRDDGKGWRLEAPTGFNDEASLHTLVEQSPQVLPLSGSPALVVLGREVRLGNGFADLLGIEDTGRPVIIEVKLAHNSEARRAVVTQILTYAAYLRGISCEDFESLLVRHIRERGFESVADAVRAHDQVASLDVVSFSENISANLAHGSFRLVIVLDESPAELVQLVGYLEAVTDGLVIDLVTISKYDVGESAILVPQRIDAERHELPALGIRPTTEITDQGYLAEGADDFVAAIGAAPQDQKPLLNKLAAWAQRLEKDGLVSVATFHGTLNGRMTLLPRLRTDNAGLVTVWKEANGSAALQFWRTVFERRAPNSLPGVERAAAPSAVGRGNTTRDITDELLNAIEAAYREATSGFVS
jgi:hypothetical protein